MAVIDSERPTSSPADGAGSFLPNDKLVEVAGGDTVFAKAQLFSEFGIGLPFVSSTPTNLLFIGRPIRAATGDSAASEFRVFLIAPPLPLVVFVFVGAHNLPFLSMAGA
jgi:hypothetical protein